MRKGVILLILSGLATAVIAKEKEDKSEPQVAADEKASNSSDLKVEAQSDSPTVLYPPNGSPPKHHGASYPPSQLRYIPGYMHIHPVRPPHGYVVLNPQQLLQKPPAANPGGQPRYIFFQQPDYPSEKANGNEVAYEVPISNSRPLPSGNAGIKPELQSEIPPRQPSPYTGPPPPPNSGGRYPGPPPSRLNPYAPPPSRFPGSSLYPTRPGPRINRYVGPLTPGYSRYRGPPAPPPPSSYYPGPSPSRYPGPPPSRYSGPPPSNSIRNPGIPPGPPPPPHPEPSYYPGPRPVTPYSNPEPPPYHSGTGRPESHYKDAVPPREISEPYPRPISSGSRHTTHSGSPPPPNSFRNTQPLAPPRPPSHFKLEDGKSTEDLPRNKERYPDSGIVRKPSLAPPGGSYNSHESSEEYDNHYVRNNYNTVRPPPRPSSPDLPPKRLYPPLPPHRHSYPKSEENSGEDHSVEYSKPPNTHEDSPPRSPPPRSFRPPPPPYGPSVTSHSTSSYSPGYSSHSSSPPPGSYHPQSNYGSDRSKKYNSDTSSEEDYNSHPPRHHSNAIPYSGPREKPESPSYTERKPVGPPSSQVPVYKPPIRSRYNPTGPPPSLKHHSEIPGLRYTPEHPSLQSAHHSESLPPRPTLDHSEERYEHPIPPRPYYGPPLPPPPHIYRDEGPPHSFPPPPQDYPSRPTLRKPTREHGPPDHYPPEDYNSVSHNRDESSSHEDDYPPRPYIPHEPIAPPSPRIPTEPRRPKAPRISYSGESRQNSAAKSHRQSPSEKDDSEEDPSGSTAAIPGEPGKDYPILSARPSTNFNCHNKPPGYYADIENRCQVYYLCGPQGHLQSFLCPNGTIFNQATFVCEWWYNVDCDDSEKHYSKNNDLYKVPDPEEKNAEKNHPGQRHSPHTSSLTLRPSYPPPSYPEEEHGYFPSEQHISNDRPPPPRALPEYRSQEPPRYPPSHQLILPESRHPPEQSFPIAPPPPPTQRQPPPSPPPSSHRHALPPSSLQSHRRSLPPPDPPLDPPPQRHPLPPPDPPSQRHPLPPPDPPSQRHLLPPPPDPPSQRHLLPPRDPPSQRHLLPPRDPPSQRDLLPPPDPPSQRHRLPPSSERYPDDYRGDYSHPDESRYRSSEEDDTPYQQEGSFQSFRTTKLDAKKTTTEKKKD